MALQSLTESGLLRVGRKRIRTDCVRVHNRLGHIVSIRIACIRVFTVLALVLSATAAIAGTTRAKAQAAFNWCPTGYVCIYAGIGEDTAIIGKYYHYRVYNLSNVVGVRTVCNHQTGSAHVRFYSGYNGTGTVLVDNFANPIADCFNYDMTPVNSIRLSAT